jgi:hypothetical protein
MSVRTSDAAVRLLRRLPVQSQGRRAVRFRDRGHDRDVLRRRVRDGLLRRVLHHHAPPALPVTLVDSEKKFDAKLKKFKTLEITANNTGHKILKKKEGGNTINQLEPRCEERETDRPQQLFFYFFFSKKKTYQLRIN